MAHVLAAVVCATAGGLVVLHVRDVQVSHGWAGFGIWESLLLFWVLSEPAAFFLGAVFAHRTLRDWQAAHRLDDLVLTPLTPVEIGYLILSHALRPTLRLLFVTLLLLLAWLLLSVTQTVVAQSVLLLCAGLLLLTLNTRLSLLAGAWSQANFSLAWSGALRPLWAQLNHFAVHCFVALALFALLLGSAVILWDRIFESGEAGAPLFIVPVLCAGSLHWGLKLAVMRAWARCLERVTFPGVSW